jgi:hypothetical protein
MSLPMPPTVPPEAPPVPALDPRELVEYLRPAGIPHGVVLAAGRSYVTVGWRDGRHRTHSRVCSLERVTDRAIALDLVRVLMAYAARMHGA